MPRFPHPAGLLIALLGCAGCGGAGTSDTLPAPTPIAIPAGASEGLRAALQMLNAPEPLERALGAERIAALDEDPAPLVPVLLVALQDPSPLVRSRAAAALGKLGDPSAVPPLIDRLEDRGEDREVRTRAAEALGRLGSSEAVGPLLEVLDDPVWHIRHHAIVALGQIGDATAEAGLAEAARYDPDLFNREEARLALERLR